MSDECRRKEGGNHKGPTFPPSFLPHPPSIHLRSPLRSPGALASAYMITLTADPMLQKKP
jgi:hypothetical protein